LRFWPLRKKTTKPLPKFCNCSSFGPQSQKNNIKITRGTSLRVPLRVDHVKIDFGGPNLPQVQNSGDGFVVFFLGTKIATLGKLED